MNEPSYDVVKRLSEILGCREYEVVATVRALLDQARPWDQIRVLYKAHQARWPGSSKQFRQAIRMAYQRGIGWDLTPEQYETLTAQECFTCDGPLGNGIALDRIDPKRGYVLDNVHPCCGPCNRLRAATKIQVWKRQYVGQSHPEIALAPLIAP